VESNQASRLFQTKAFDELLRRFTNNLLEYPLKVKRRKAGNRSQFIQRHLPVNCLLDMPDNLVDAFKKFLGLPNCVCVVVRLAVGN